MTTGKCTADLILHNGTIWCGLNEGECQAVAVWQGRILATGSDAEILELRGPETRLVDLKGRFASPGLNDDHLHLISLGLTMDWVDASPDAAPNVYVYKNVTGDDHTALMNAESIGKHFIATIKSQPEKFPFRKMTDEEAKS